VPVDVQRVEHELSRIADRVLSERNQSSPSSNDTAPVSDGQDSPKRD
jgi:hypothetical protein